MPFNKDLDVELFQATHNFEGTRLTVGVFQYNNGDKKLQIVRQNVNSDGELSFTKMGRLRKEEVEAIIPSIQKALEVM